MRVLGLPAGYYVMDATQQGRSVRNGGLRAGGGELRVTLGTDGATVTGRVLAEDGSAIAECFRDPGAEGRRPAATGPIGSGGRLPLLDRCGAGEYRLAAVDATLGEGQRQDSAVLAQVAADGVEIAVQPRELKTLDVKLLR